MRPFRHMAVSTWSLIVRGLKMPLIYRWPTNVETCPQILAKTDSQGQIFQKLRFPLWQKQVDNPIPYCGTQVRWAIQGPREPRVVPTESTECVAIHMVISKGFLSFADVSLKTPTI